MPGKIALVTGASSGFGLLTSIELAKAGFRVVATMRDLGRRDVLVNNAGFAVAGFAEHMKLEELRLQFETSFFGAVAMTKAAQPKIRRQHSGHIIQVSSIAGWHGSVTVSSYSASKHALEEWSESLRMEVNALGIKVVLVEPGAFQTDIWTRGAVMGEQASKERSPNIQPSLRMRSTIEKLPKADPIVVARAIVAIAQDPNPKLCYLVGRDAKMQLALKPILPWQWHEKVVANFLKIDQES